MQMGALNFIKMEIFLEHWMTFVGTHPFSVPTKWNEVAVGELHRLPFLMVAPTENSQCRF